MLSSKSRKIIGLSGAIIVFVVGILALTITEPFASQWYIGMVFVVISIAYFVVATYLKSRKV